MNAKGKEANKNLMTSVTNPIESSAAVSRRRVRSTRHNTHLLTVICPCD